MRNLLEHAQHNDGGFVAFFDPKTTLPRAFVFSSEQVLCYQHWQDLPNSRGFLIAPFAISSECPIIFLPITDINEVELSEPLESSPPISNPTKINPNATQAYQTAFDRCRYALCKGKFEKLVLARMAELEQTNTQIDPIDTFVNAHKHYPSAYTYILYTPTSGLWIGSTPEALLQGSGPLWRTMALAGTQAYPNDAAAPTEWSSKNKEEQQLVTRYLVEQLERLGIHPEQSEPYTIRAGELIHLQTDLSFSTHPAITLGDLVASLHPTPAVCGLPKELALTFIQEVESQPRTYYSGCLGLIDPEGASNLFVNLRCLSHKGQKIRLYAGGGLLASSTLSDEWLETERKMQTMKSVLVTKR